MRDEWYGHRDVFSFLPDGDKDEYLDIDFALFDALQTIEDNTDQYGLLSWELEDELVEVAAVKKKHKFAEARDLATKGSEKKPYKPEPGEYFIPDVYTRRSDGHIQTWDEWQEAMTRKAQEEGD